MGTPFANRSPTRNATGKMDSTAGFSRVKKVRGSLHEVLIVVATWVKTDCRELLDWGYFFAAKAPTSNDTDKMEVTVAFSRLNRLPNVFPEC